MRLCACCRQPTAPTPANVIRPQISPWMYAVLFNCDCGSTLAVVIWEAPEDA